MRFAHCMCGPCGWEMLVLAYQLWANGNERRRAELVDEMSPLPVVAPARSRQ